MKKLIAFGWYGGKYSHLDWLLPLLPVAKRYVEPFGGSAAVLLNRPRSREEVYNDLDPDLANFFSVLRDAWESLYRAAYLTPNSREEYRTATMDSPASPLERARLFYMKTRLTRMGLTQVADTSFWLNSVKSSDRKMASSNSRWLSGMENLGTIARRLASVHVDNRSAFDVIADHDSEDSVIYCDPPYTHDSRVRKNGYRTEMTDSEHMALGELLGRCQARVAVSGYESPVMDRAFPSSLWKKTIGKDKFAFSSKKSSRTEILWTNYDPETGDRL